MKGILSFEHKRQAVAPRRVFLQRLGRNVLIALGLFAASLLAGMAGYMGLEGMGWVEAYDNAAMILSGMGPYKEPATAAGQLFSGTYALYCGFLIAGATALILAPVFHRVLHRFHVESDDDEQRSERRGAKRH